MAICLLNKFFNEPPQWKGPRECKERSIVFNFVVFWVHFSRKQNKVLRTTGHNLGQNILSTFNFHMNAILTM